MSENSIEQMVRDFLARIIQGTFDGVYTLEEASRDRVMEHQAESCVRGYIELHQLPDDLDLDAFLERMETAEPGRIRIQRDGNAIIFDEPQGGQCSCPLVTQNVIPLRAELCRCSVSWIRKLFERHVRGPVRVEMLESVALGSQNCVFRIEIDDPSPTARERE
jgi:hypothetical protein